jgi:lipopolysaccharide export system permease protein
MKLNSITYRYILKEMLAPFGINIFVFTFLLLMTKMVDITKWIVNYNLSIWAVLNLIFLMMPWLLMFIIPMSVMVAVLLTFLRLSGDNEIVALKSGGLSVYGLLPPVLFFSLVGCLLTLFITTYGSPRAKASLGEMALRVAASNLDIGLKERTFNDTFKDVILYVNQIDLQNKRLIDIFIEDKRQPKIVNTVIAPEGRLFRDPEKLIFHLVLYNGTIHQTNRSEHSATSIRFDTYELSLDLGKEFKRFEDRHKHHDEMTIAELRNFLNDSTSEDEDYYKAEIALHRRFSIPVACLALGVLAFPLGIQSKSAKRSYGVILSLFFFLLYYLMLTAGYAFGETGIYPPVIGMWLPNVVMAGMGLYFLIQTARERTLKIGLLSQRIQQFFSKFNRFKNNP